MDNEGRADLHERQAEVVGSAAPVHRVLQDVEGKDRHLLFQQDAKIITWPTHTGWEASWKHSNWCNGWKFTLTHFHFCVKQSKVSLSLRADRSWSACRRSIILTPFLTNNRQTVRPAAREQDFGSGRFCSASRLLRQLAVSGCQKCQSENQHRFMQAPPVGRCAKAKGEFCRGKIKSHLNKWRDVFERNREGLTERERERAREQERERSLVCIGNCHVWSCSRFSASSSSLCSSPAVAPSFDNCYS